MKLSCLLRTYHYLVMNHLKRCEAKQKGKKIPGVYAYSA